MRALTTFHRRCMRAMCNDNLRSTRNCRIKTATLEARLGVAPIDQRHHRRSFGWAGEVLRMPMCRLPRKLLHSPRGFHANGPQVRCTTGATHSTRPSQAKACPQPFTNHPRWRNRPRPRPRMTRNQRRGSNPRTLSASNDAAPPTPCTQFQNFLMFKLLTGRLSRPSTSSRAASQPE